MGISIGLHDCRPAPGIHFQAEIDRWVTPNFSGSRMYQEKLRVCSELTDPRYPEMTNGCFVAGTLVWTDKGLVPIEQIKIGDRVLSKPENGTGEQAYKRVVNTFVHEDKEIWFMHYGHGHTMAETIVYGTANHPVWVDGKGWTSIDSLRPGDDAVTEDGSGGVIANAQPVWATKEGHVGFRCWSESDERYGSLVDFSDGVVEIESELGNEFLWKRGAEDGSLLKRRVFNIEVEDFHTYYVGQPGIWVHNTSKKGGLTIYTSNVRPDYCLSMPPSM